MSVEAIERMKKWVNRHSDPSYPWHTMEERARYYEKVIDFFPYLASSLSDESLEYYGKCMEKAERDRANVVPNLRY